MLRQASPAYACPSSQTVNITTGLGMSTNAYDHGLERNHANHVPLSPLSFLERSARVYGEHLSVIHGATRYTWKQTHTRCKRLASALTRRGIGVGHTVAALLPNTPAMFEAHFGVPMAGAVLNALNTRLDAQSLAFMLAHGDAQVLLVDREFSATVRHALALLGDRKLLVVDVEDPLHDDEVRVGELTYNDLLCEGDPTFMWIPSDEWNAIALNYTSGTTGDPKGVVTHHRGAYLNAVSNVIAWNMQQHPVYLWTLPMFHCNGWCFPWTMALQGGTSICLRRVDPQQVFSMMRQHQVTHLCGAPIVYGMLVNAPATWREGLTRPIQGLIAGAAPPAAVIEGCERIGIELTHVYGLTEVYGPAAVCAKQPGWDALPLEDRARLNSRQGVASPMQEEVAVLDPRTMEPVPADGHTMGEVCFRGNLVMKGYLKNAAANAEAFKGGWFWTGDLAVVHVDGYIKIKDRSKDIIISGGENISSLEVEEILYRHPAVLSAAVVAKPDSTWGEVPCAFIELRDGAESSESEIIEYCRLHMARFKVPKQVVLEMLPKTATGKIQKSLLREQVRSASAIS